MIKVMTIVGTRPEIIKLSQVIKVLDEHTDHTLVHTGQNYDYELNELFFEQLGIRKPDHFLDAAKKTVAKTIGSIVTKTDEVIAKIKPDALLIYGDTNSCLSVISAKKRKVPIFHMEAGNRCFDQRVPEEVNRKIVDHLSDINMPLSDHARDYLLNEGIRPETIIKTGSPMKEVLDANMEQIHRSVVLAKEKLEPRKYFLLSVHREENLDIEANITSLLDSIDAISQHYGLPIVISTHPRTKKKLDELEVCKENELIRYSKPYGFHEYNKLQMNAFCVISDSGTITEESSILNFPAITIREAHERPEGMDEGTLIMSGLSKDRVIEAIDVVTSQQGENRITKIVTDYDVDNVSLKVLRIILSYTDYVNRTVWHKT